jgi:hypothetical protein
MSFYDEIDVFQPQAHSPWRMSRVGRLCSNGFKLFFGTVTTANAGIFFLFDGMYANSLFCGMNSGNCAALVFGVVGLAFTFCFGLVFGWLGINLIRSALTDAAQAVYSFRSRSSFVVLGTMLAIAFMLFGIGYGMVHR